MYPKFSMRHLLMLLILLFQTPVAIAAPHANIPQIVYHFETVLEGDIVTHSFEVRNTGDTPLHLHFIKVGCDCTRVIAFPEILMPGQTGAVAVELNTQGFGGTAINKEVVFESNDPRQKKSHSDACRECGCLCRDNALSCQARGSAGRTPHPDHSGGRHP